MVMEKQLREIDRCFCLLFSFPPKICLVSGLSQAEVGNRVSTQEIFDSMHVSNWYLSNCIPTVLFLYGLELRII